MIKTITIEAVSIKTTKKDGTPYTYAEKNKTTKAPTGKIIPRTMVSLKYKDATTAPEGDWLMGWSYKAGSAAEALTAGQTIDIKYEESAKVNPDGTTTIFKSWRFPKEEDKKDDEIAKLKAQLAAVQTPVTPPATPALNVPPAMPTPSGTSETSFHSPTPAAVADGSVPVSDVPF